MQSQSNHCVCCLWSGLLLLLISSATTASAVESVKLWNATAARPYLLRGAESRLLDRAEQFLAEEQWGDARAALLRLLESDSVKLVALEDSRYVSLRQYCHRLLARLPETHLNEYRGLVDTAAESWYRQAMAERDVELLQRVVERYFCSSWADDALFAWGELALQRGDYQVARNAWLRLSSQLSADSGLLTYPDTDIPLDGIQARLVLVSLRAGEWQRAERELLALRSDSPTAVGRLGGREVNYAEHLTELITQAKSWEPLVLPSREATFAATFQRTNSYEGFDLQEPFELIWSQPIASQKPLSTFPIVVDDRLIFQDDLAVHALNLADGEMAFRSEGDIFRSPSMQRECLGQPRHTLTAHGQQVFGTTTALLGPRRNPNETRAESSFWSINMDRDGALTFRVPSDDPKVTFAGAPLVIDGRVYLAVRSNDQTARAGIACYDLHTREQLWQRWLTQANTPATGWANEWANNLLTYDAGMLYVCTNLGSIAAVRAHDGQVGWLRTYERYGAVFNSQGECDYYRGPNPPIVHRGILFSLPTDGLALQAVDAANGQQLWQVTLDDPTARLVAVVDEKVVVSNDGLQVYDSDTGKLVSTKAVGKLKGQPVVLQQTVAWPTDTKIELVNLADAGAEMIRLDLPQDGGANLAVAKNYLIAAGAAQLSLYRIFP